MKLADNKNYANNLLKEALQFFLLERFKNEETKH